VRATRRVASRRARFDHRRACAGPGRTFSTHRYFNLLSASPADAAAAPAAADDGGAQPVRLPRREYPGSTPGVPREYPGSTPCCAQACLADGVASGLDGVASAARWRRRSLPCGAGAACGCHVARLREVESPCYKCLDVAGGVPRRRGVLGATCRARGVRRPHAGRPAGIYDGYAYKYMQYIYIHICIHTYTYIYISIYLYMYT
jgi:hypothetical protein